MSKVLLTLGLSTLGLAAHGAAQERTISGPVAIRNYSRQVHGGHGQSWDSVQDRRGVHVFAKGGSEFAEFDGATWRRTSLGSNLRSLALGADGRVYLGGRGELGYLEPDTTQTLRFVSLLDQLPPEHQAFARIDSVASVADAVAFSAGEALFLWNGGSMKVLASFSEQPLGKVFAVSDRLFVVQDGVGLLMIESGGTRKVPGGEALAEMTIAAMLENPDGSILGFTRLAGPFRYDGRSVEFLDAPAADRLIEAQVTDATRLPDGGIAVATFLSGVLLLDDELSLRYVVDRAQGLINESAHSITLDRAGTLWVTSDYGIASIQYRPYLWKVPAEAGLNGVIRSLVDFQGEMHVGTSLGCFVRIQEPAGDRFEPLPYLSTVTWTMLNAGDAMLAGTSDGVFEVRPRDGDDTRSTIPRPVTTQYTQQLLRLRRAPERVIAASQWGARMLVEDEDGWREEGSARGIDVGISGAIEGDAGEILLDLSENNTLLVANFPNGYDAPPEVLRVPLNGSRKLAEINGDIVLYGSRAAERYRGLEAAKRGEALEPHRELTELLATANGGTHSLTQDGAGRLWHATSDHLMLATLAANGRYRFDRIMDLPDLRASAADPRDPAQFWLATKGGSFRYLPDQHDTIPPRSSVIVRRVASLGGSSPDRVLYGGASAAGREDSDHMPLVIDGNVRFEVGHTAYGPLADYQLQYFLDGFDTDWSSWRAEAVKEYTNLDSGQYVFRARSRDRLGRLGEEARFDVVVQE